MYPSLAIEVGPQKKLWGGREGEKLADMDGSLDFEFEDPLLSSPVVTKKRFLH